MNDTEIEKICNIVKQCLYDYKLKHWNMDKRECSLIVWLSMDWHNTDTGIKEIKYMINDIKKKLSQSPGTGRE